LIFAMASIDATRQKLTDRVAVWRRFDTLRTLGLAAQRFEGYVNFQTRQKAVDVVLLTCIVRGTARHIMGDRVVTAGPGDVGITHYDQKHALVTGRGGVDVINLYLDLENHALPILPRPLQGTLSRLLAPHPGLINRLNRRVDIHLPEVATMLEPLEMILREQQQRQPGYEVVMTHAMEMFRIQCARAAGDASTTSTAGVAMGGEVMMDENQPGWLEVIRRLIEERFDEPLCLDDLVRRAQVSREHVCRSFKTYTGRSPMAYLNDRRIQAAMWRLRTTRASMVDVAVACGFEDVSHFSRKFKAMVGCTPGRYRKTLGT
jgi:AraC-like DNA-binding protein